MARSLHRVACLGLLAVFSSGCNNENSTSTTPLEGGSIQRRVEQVEKDVKPPVVVKPNLPSVEKDVKPPVVVKPNLPSNAPAPQEKKTPGSN